MARFFYSIIFLAGIGAILASLLYAFSVVQPKLWGVRTQAHAVKYYAYQDNPSNRKQVDYTFAVNGQQNSGTQEVGEAAYKQRLETFALWYMPDNPESKRYVAIRDYGDMLLVGLGLLIGLLFLYLPRFGRDIDAKTEAGTSITMQGCVCKAKPGLMLKVEYAARKYGLLISLIFAILLLVGALLTIISGAGYRDLILLCFVVLVVDGVPFVITFWRWSRRGHSLRCAARRAGFQAIFWSLGTGSKSGPIREVQKSKK